MDELFWVVAALCFQLVFLGLIAQRLREIRDKLSDRNSDHKES
jgi:hypothetical protein